MRSNFTRSKYLIVAGVLAVLLTLAASGYESARASFFRPPPSQISHGPMSGEVTDHSAVLWARGSDRTSSSELVFEVSSDPSFQVIEQSQAMTVTAATDFTGDVEVGGLQSNTDYYYRVIQNGDRYHAKSGHLITAPAPDSAAGFSFLFGACLGGQGYCRDIYNGWQIFDAMDAQHPDFLVLIGDGVYIDTECYVTDEKIGDVEMKDLKSVPGQEEKAEDLASIRSRYRYHLEDASYAKFLSHTPVYVSWDDHEVDDNFYGTNPDPKKAALFDQGRQAFFEYWPLQDTSGQNQIYRTVSYGALADFFILDTRSYRHSLEREDSPSKTMLGLEQFDWLLQELNQSQAVWKFVVTSVPLGYTTGNFPDQEPFFRDGWADFPGEFGYEEELSLLIKHINRHQIKNVVFLTGDTHWPFAISYDPDADGYPNFYELGSSPMSAIVLSPKDTPDDFGATGILDRTFNPTLLYRRDDASGFTVGSDRRFNFGKITLASDGRLTFDVFVQTIPKAGSPAERYEPESSGQLPITLVPSR